MNQCVLSNFFKIYKFIIWLIFQLFQISVKIVHSDLLTFKGETSGVEISTRNTDFVSKVSEPISR